MQAERPVPGGSPASPTLTFPYPTRVAMIIYLPLRADLAHNKRISRRPPFASLVPSVCRRFRHGRTQLFNDQAFTRDDPEIVLRIMLLTSLR